MQSIRRNISLYVAAGLLIIVSAVKLSNPHTNYISYDNFGYYIYLPASFIYSDPEIKDFSWVKQISEKYNSTPTFYQFDRGADGNSVIRFFIGMSILYSPGFAAGHIAALNSGYPADGFSLPYQWGLIAWGLLFSLIGIMVLRKVLLEFFSDKLTAIILTVLVLGTNLYFFITYGNDTPHAYLFTVYAILMWFLIKWHKHHKLKYAIGLGLITGLLVITRPSEIIVFFVILLWNVDSRSAFKEKLKLLWTYRTHLALFAASGIIFALLQMLYWKAATGKFIFFAYTDPGSGFDFLNPHIYRALFSFRKGWFIYSPLMIFSIWGFYYLYKENKKIFVPLIVFLILNVYFISAFSSLISYGYRAFIQSYAIMAIPLGYFIKKLLELNAWVKLTAVIVFIAVMIINLVQAWQIRMGVLHGSRTTAAYYFSTFMKTKISDKDRELLLIDRSLTAVEDENKYNRKLLDLIGFENPEVNKMKSYDTIIVYQGEYSFKMDSNMKFSPAVTAKYKDITDDYYAWIRISVNFYPTVEFTEGNLLLVAHFDYHGRPHKYRAFSTAGLKDIQVNEWNKMSFDYLTPEVRSKNEKLKVYVWYRGKQAVYIDNLRVDAFERK